MPTYFLMAHSQSGSVFPLVWQVCPTDMPPLRNQRFRFQPYGTQFHTAHSSPVQLVPASGEHYITKILTFILCSILTLEETLKLVQGDLLVSLSKLSSF